MIIGVIGASSNIAGKAYLPVYAKLQDQHNFVMYSRDFAKANQIKEQYHFELAASDIDSMLNCDLVFIHAATSQHFELAKKFLEAGVPVCMDKPISEDYDEVLALEQIAEANNVLFAIAFNRRFAPLSEKLKAVSDKNMVKVTKNLAHHSADLKFTMSDVFIHPLDTMIYLLDDQIEDWTYRIKRNEKGELSRLTVMAETKTATGLAMMNLESGAFIEEFEVESSTGTHRLSELVHLEDFVNSDKTSHEVNGWQTATYNRGFDAIVLGMIEAVKKFDGSNRQALLAEMKQENILKSHEIIRDIMAEVTK